MTDKTQDKLVNYLMDRTDKFGDYISELAKQLGVAAEHVYEVMVRQQYTEAVGLFVENGLYILMFVVLGILLGVMWKKGNKKIKEGDWDDIAYLPMGIVTFIVFLLFMLNIFEIIGDIKLAVMKMINPEYYALKDIMEFIQSKVKK